MLNNIRKHRKELKYTLETLANMAGTTKSYIWDLEAGKSTPNIRLAYAISKALQANVVDVFPDDQEYDEVTIKSVMISR